MRTAVKLSCALLWVALLPCAHAKSIELDANEQARLGLHLETLKSVTLESTATATAIVLDPVPLLKMDADLRAAQATGTASQKERDRLQALQGEDSRVSAKTLEAAEAQFAADAAHLAGAKGELAASWGAAIARMDSAQRRALIDSLSAGNSALLRVDALQELHATPQSVRLQNPTGKSLSAQLLGTWPQAGDNLHGTAWLIRVNATGFSSGLTTSASLVLPGRRQGVLLPAAAVVRWSGFSWIFVATDATHFDRRVVSGAEQLPEGWLVSEGFKAGEQVVVQGAATLLSAQTLED